MKITIMAVALLLAANTGTFAQIVKKQINQKTAAVKKGGIKAENKSSTLNKSNIAKIPADKVCMINNKLMSKPQIAVPVNGKVYYGCCQMCVSKLTDDAKSRMATDALTQQNVDKSIAYIILKPGSQDDVLYFASKANAEQYLKSQKKS